MKICKHNSLRYRFDNFSSLTRRSCTILVTVSDKPSILTSFIDPSTDAVTSTRV